MKEKIQVKISKQGFTYPQIETGINNEKAQEIAGNLSYDYIKILIQRGVLVKNYSESKDNTDVYDLIY